MTYCDSGAVKLKAGSAVSSSITADQYSQLIQQAEGAINSVMKINFSGSYGTLNADNKKILEDAASSHAAISAIYYDTTNYSSKQARTLANINYTRFFDAIQLLKEKAVTDFIEGTT